MTQALQYATRLTPAAVERLVARGLWERTTMAAACDRFAAERPSAIAVTDAAHRYTWQELKTLTDGLAVSLVRLGLNRGERVLVQLPGGAAEMIVRLALKKAGLVGAYAPVQWREQELAEALRRLGPAAVILPLEFKGHTPATLFERVEGAASVRLRICLEATPPRGWVALPQLLAHCASAAEVEALCALQVRFDEISTVTSSSGSTGLPKLCAWPEAAQLALARGVAERTQLTAADAVGIFCPIAGGGGLMLAVCCGFVPCKYTIAGDYSAEALLSLVERERLTVIATVPAILARLAQAPAVAHCDLRSLRVIRVGTAAANPELARLAEERLGCVVVQAAGAMEIGCFAQVELNEPTAIRHGGTVGRPLVGIEARLVDERGVPVACDEVGELQLWSAFAAVGYVGDESRAIQGWDPDDPECWFKTGDLARRDPAGRLSIVGRRKEMINRSGLKVFPHEVERVIAQHPSVEEAAVVGVPDPVYGEVPWAFVLPRSGANAVLGELEQHLRAAGLAPFKIPARFIVVDELPRAGGTKVSKSRLLELYAPTAKAPTQKTSEEAL